MLRTKRATSALGAAILGAAIKGLLTPGMVLPKFKQLYPWLFERTPIDCPACHCEMPAVFVVIAHLNDHHRWTRDAISKWVDMLELKLGVMGGARTPW